MTSSPREREHGVDVQELRARSATLFDALKGPGSDKQHKAARDALVALHLPLVEHFARRFLDRGEPLDDLVQVGSIGLIKAIDGFDVDRGVEFSTYASPTILGEIKRHFRDRGWAIRVPRRLQELRLSIVTATGELTQQLGRAPTVAELARRLEVSDEEIVDGLEAANAYTTLSLDGGDDDDAGWVEPKLSSLSADDDALDRVENRETIRPLLATLDPRERHIVVLRFFRGMTQSQIAAELGISQMHVSRLLARTLTRLRTSLTDTPG